MEDLSSRAASHSQSRAVGRHRRSSSQDFDHDDHPPGSPGHHEEASADAPRRNSSFSRDVHSAREAVLRALGLLGARRHGSGHAHGASSDSLSRMNRHHGAAEHGVAQLVQDGSGQISDRPRPPSAAGSVDSHRGSLSGSHFDHVDSDRGGSSPGPRRSRSFLGRSRRLDSFQVEAAEEMFYRVDSDEADSGAEDGEHAFASQARPQAEALETLLRGTSKPREGEIESVV